MLDFFTRPEIFYFHKFSHIEAHYIRTISDQLTRRTIPLSLITGLGRYSVGNIDGKVRKLLLFTNFSHINFFFPLNNEVTDVRDHEPSAAKSNTILKSDGITTQ